MRRALAAVVAVLVALAGPAYAAWSDPATVGSGAVAAHTVLPPASLSCAEALSAATFSWPHRDLRYSYRVTLERPVGSQIGSPRTVTATGGVGSTVSTTYTASDVSELLSLGDTFTVRVRSFITGAASWLSSGSVTGEASYLPVLGIGVTSCG